MSFPRYEEYKESGVEWLGEVPEHWAIRRMKTLFEIKKRIAGEIGYDILSITQNGIKVKDTESNEGQVAMDYAKYQFVYPGDFAMNHMDLLTGYIDISKVEGVTSPDYRVFSVRNPTLSHPGFFLRLFQNAYHQKIFYAFGQGASQFGRWRLPTEAFNDFALPYPPLSEQVLIGNFLDRETAKIDSLIEEQRRLIELLKEKRQAVISHAVTKGLEPEASLRDSGVASFGSVPSHWAIRKVHALAKVGNGSTPSRERFDYWNGGEYPWLSSTVVNQEEVTQAEQFVTELALKECHLPKISPPAVLIGITGQGKTRGMATTLRFEATINQHIAAVVPRNSEIDIEFLRRIFDMLYIDLRTDSEGGGSTKGAITCEQIQGLRIALPPVAEQIAIASWIRARNEEFVALIGQAESAIALLEERRSALISAAVTGKIDVRNHTPKEAA